MAGAHWQDDYWQTNYWLFNHWLSGVLVEEFNDFVYVAAGMTAGDMVEASETAGDAVVTT